MIVEWPIMRELLKQPYKLYKRDKTSFFLALRLIIECALMIAWLVYHINLITG